MKKINWAPVIIFTYNRPSLTKKLLNSLSKCDNFDKSKIIIYSDKFKKYNPIDKNKVLEVRKELIKFKNKNKNVAIFFHKENLGLFRNLIGGISKILKKYPKAIVVEDDLILHKNFISYMNKSLSLYKNKKNALQVSGYSYPIKYNSNRAYFLNITSCWGWGTWSDRWREFLEFTQDKTLINKIYKKINSNLKIKNEFNIQSSYDYLKLLKKQIDTNFNSWGVLFYLFSFKKKYLNLFPPYNLVQNKGFDGSGVHKSTSDIFSKKTLSNISNVIFYPKSLKKNNFILKQISLFLKKELNIINRIIHSFL